MGATIIFDELNCICLMRTPFKSGVSRVNSSFRLSTGDFVSCHSPVGAYETPVFVQVRDLERNPEFNIVYESMMAGQTGSRLLQAERIVSKGDTLLEGIVSRSFPATYYWKPVRLL